MAPRVKRLSGAPSAIARLHIPRRPPRLSASPPRLPQSAPRGEIRPWVILLTCLAALVVANFSAESAKAAKGGVTPLSGLKDGDPHGELIAAALVSVVEEDPDPGSAAPTCADSTLPISVFDDHRPLRRTR